MQVRESVMSALKVGSAWGAVGVSKWHDLWEFIGINSWQNLASAAAFVYSSLLIAEWIWKHIARPKLEAKGLVKRKARRQTDSRY